VCRRILRNYHDVEEAFQAAFLVLVRKAASVVPREMVANWLYGVAYQTALKAGATAAKRRARERQVIDMPEPKVVERDHSDHLRFLLDQELSCLPDKYRVVILLCDLQGKTRKEAARQLELPEGTVAGRLARARGMLARRLARHGLAVSGAALTGVLSQTAAPACVPTSVVSATIKAASLVVAGQAATAGVISAKVVALTEGVLKTTWLTKLKITTVLLLAAGIVTAGVSWPAYQTLVAVEARAKDTDLREWGSNSAAERTADEQSIRGSGKVITQEMQLAGFTTVEVGRSIQVELSRADSFRVAITADDNLLPHIKVTKDGSMLRLALDPKLKSFWATTLKATVAMPALEGVSLAKQSKVTCEGFKSTKGFQAKLIDRSTLDGEIETAKADLDVEGASRVTLKGSAKEAKISGSEQCRLFLADFSLDRADITLRNGSTATVNVKERLDYDLRTACRVEYRGSPPVTKGSTSGGSQVLPLAAGSGEAETEPNSGNPHHHQSRSHCPKKG
jgi:RNA polymerase sigma factor (sigma-70 family)